MRRSQCRLFISGLSLCCVFSFAGCDTPVDNKPVADSTPVVGGPPVAGGSVGQPAAGAAAAPNSKAGFAQGRITTADGKPIRAKRVKYHILVQGITASGSTRLGYDPQPDADGNYRIKVLDGMYKTTAYIEVPFAGKIFRYDLEPIQPDGYQSASDGVVRDFIWRIKGARPGGNSNPTIATDWFGAQVDIHLALETRQSQWPPEGTTYVFTATPSDNLVDGSQGKPVVFERKYDPVFHDVDNEYLADIPLGAYQLSGKQTLPDGKVQTLLLDVSGGHADAIDLVFAPITNDGVPMANQVHFIIPN